MVYDMMSLVDIEEKYGAVHTYLTPDLLDKIRTYLSHIQLLAYSVSDHVQKVTSSCYLSRSVSGVVYLL